MTERDAWLSLAGQIRLNVVVFICEGIMHLPCCIGYRDAMFNRMSQHKPGPMYGWLRLNKNVPWWPSDDAGRRNRIEFCHKMAALCADDMEPDYAI